VKVAPRQSGFTLIELLVVISILGILVALTVPALKNLGKSNVSVSAARQLLDDVGRARLLAISHHTTVYMIFVSTNYWVPSNVATNLFNADEMAALANLADKQLTGYTFVSYGALGDQPGNHQWNYLAPWQTLPDNSFIASWKFLPQPFTTQVGVTNGFYTVHGFNVISGIPFPTIATSTLPPCTLPYIAFNYLGQLTVDGVNPSFVDEYIPLAQGSVSYSINPTNKVAQMFLVGPGGIVETPPGNSTNSMFNLVHIDALTGRSRLEFQQVQ
jgi:prepilin-type N-terminal cleavage/methylation domain-containing protein